MSKRMGRPKATKPRTKGILLKVNAEEYMRIKSNAQQRNMPVAVYLRNLGLSPPCEPTPDDKQ